MVNLKRILCGVVCCVMLLSSLSLGSCGNNGDDGKDTNNGISGDAVSTDVPSALPENLNFEEVGHPTECGSIDMYGIVKALVNKNWDGYVRPDHGRMIWGEKGRYGYGLFDRALGATYIAGLFEALEKSK